MPGVGAYFVLPPERGDARLLDMFRRVEVGFAGGKTTDIFTRSLQGLGFAIDGQGRGWRNVASPSGQWRRRIAHDKRGTKRSRLVKGKPAADGHQWGARHCPPAKPKPAPYFFFAALAGMASNASRSSSPTLASFWRAQRFKVARCSAVMRTEIWRCGSRDGSQPEKS